MNKWLSFDQYITDKVRKQYLDERKDHVPSGKLSASLLPKPLLWQILYTIGVPKKEADDYLLGVFERGRDLEEKVIHSRFPTVIERQKQVKYRDTVGLIDAIVDFEGEQTPVEIKSVNYRKFQRIGDEVDEQYLLQATLYGMAIKSKTIGIHVIDTQSMQFTTFRYPTAYMARMVESIIDAYQTAMKRRTMPIFEARYKWQENAKYQDYPDFTGLTSKEIVDKLKVDYPQAYKLWNNITP